MRKFQTHVKDSVNTTRPHWGFVNIGSGNGLVPSLRQQGITCTNVDEVLWRHMQWVNSRIAEVPARCGHHQINLKTEIYMFSQYCVHYSDVTMSTMASQITGVSIAYSIVYSGKNQRKHQSSASLAFVRGLHRWPVNSPHRGPVTRKMQSDMQRNGVTKPRSLISPLGVFLILH